ncbi:hypothetical protein [Desulfohalobium retbaense]|uniref:Uncharacterized protein n=1 Tax=Desulfohalobium retbaense (strain ATCC 49708 / DSM 5692 / JCM 16813 / HR100) TaxID=485915 RepID=C8X5X6_DESRD|nr:hypothetical protein [Desulfohalobium retbaense]ACV69823.1 hypothetical protein Dret_2547 [Desulfohalobium retbaense DSM 5692]
MNSFNFYLSITIVLLLLLPQPTYSKQAPQDNIEWTRNNVEKLETFQKFKNMKLEKVINARVDLALELFNIYREVFKIKPDMRIKIRNYNIILNKSIDLMNLTEVNLHATQSAKEQFVKEFTKIAQQIDRSYLSKIKKAMALDYILFKKLYVY